MWRLSADFKTATRFILNNVAMQRRWIMDAELMLDVSQAHELKLAFRKGGWDNADIKKLCEGDLAGRLLPVVKGLADIVAVKHIIDCDADPLVPEGFTLKEHRKGGQIVWDPTKFQLYLSEGQKNDKFIAGKDLDRELAGVSGILNANVLDYFLAHQEIIPPECEGVVTYFWATKYLSGGDSYVRCLYRDGRRWCSRFNWLVHDWNDDSPAARLAS